jgi:hypothetical protein
MNNRATSFIPFWRQRKGLLFADRRARLEELRFVWDARDPSWEIMFDELERYRKENGHCNVPQRRHESSRLAKWVSFQRALKTQGRLTSDRKVRLDALGFVWSVKNHTKVPMEGGQAETC